VMSSQTHQDTRRPTRTRTVVGSNRHDGTETPRHPESPRAGTITGRHTVTSTSLCGLESSRLEQYR